MNSRTLPQLASLQYQSTIPLPVVPVVVSVPGPGPQPAINNILPGPGIAVTGTIPAPTVALTNTTVTGAGGPVGDSTHVPVITYDAQGRLTAVSTVGVSSGGGYLGIPQNVQTGNYTLVALDADTHIYHPGGAAAATYTIPANAAVAFAIGTVVNFVNMSVNAVTIAITTDTLYLSPGGTTGSRTLAQYGRAVALKITATSWLINGTGLT